MCLLVGSVVYFFLTCLVLSLGSSDRSSHNGHHCRMPATMRGVPVPA